MKLLIILALGLAACSKVPDFENPTSEVDQSSTLVSEDDLRSHGCLFTETIDHRFRAQCDSDGTVEKFYDQNLSLLDYYTRAELFLNSNDYKSQNQTTKTLLLGKKMASSLAMALSTLETIKQFDDHTMTTFYKILLRVAIDDHLIVRFSRDTNPLSWSIGRPRRTERDEQDDHSVFHGEQH